MSDLEDRLSELALTGDKSALDELHKRKKCGDKSIQSTLNNRTFLNQPPRKVVTLSKHPKGVLNYLAPILGFFASGVERNHLSLSVSARQLSIPDHSCYPADCR